MDAKASRSRRGGWWCGADDCVMALALAVQHHRGEDSRVPLVLTYPPPAERARLIAEEMAWRAEVLREHGIERGFGRGEPLEVVIGRLRGF